MQTQLISLYDYLGRAAGQELGWSVAKYARSVQTQVGTRLVQNSKYSGEINLYTREFIEQYFNHPYHADIIAADTEQYNKRKRK